MVVAYIALLNWSTYLVPLFYAPTLFSMKFSKDDVHDVNIRTPKKFNGKISKYC